MATATVAFGSEVFPQMGCDHGFVSKTPGVNTAFLTIGSAAGPDIPSVGATGSNDGVLLLPDADGSAAMAVSALNNGLGDGSTGDASEVSVTASIRDTFPALPLIIQVCATDAASACMAAASETIDLAIGDDPGFIGVIAFGQRTKISLDAANTRITLDLKNAAGQTLSSTCVAVVAPATP